MNNALLKDLLATFNRDTFSKFIFNFWKLHDSENEHRIGETCYLPKIGDNIFETKTIKYIESNTAIDSQNFNLVIPFFYPSELFNKNDKIFQDPTLLSNLKKYKRLINKRVTEWYWPQDGQYNMPIISFVSNYSGLEKEIYFERIIPAFQSMIDKIELDAQAAVGSIDSFIELNKDTLDIAVERFFKDFTSELAISFEGEISVNDFTSEKYLTNGVLQNSLNPCEPIFVNRKYDKIEIIKEFESILNSGKTESQLEKFLTKYYKEIFGVHYDRIESQIWLKVPELDINNKDRRLDIFLRNSIERDWELFELKRETKLTRSYRDIPTFCSEINLAIQQVKNYKRILNQDKVKSLLSKQGIEYYEPEYRLVVGNKPDISTSQWRWLKKTNENDLKILTYEDILSEMKMRFYLHEKNYLRDY